MKDYEKYDALALAGLVRKKEIFPEELLEAAISRVEKLNPKINAVITRMYEEGREAIRQGLPEGPFTGVPFLLKDLGPLYAGVPMAAGTKFLKKHLPDHDSELTRRFKKAGLIIFGKTNTPELGIQPTTEPLASGPTRNPWDLERSSGGSSGGSAAAVASGMVPMAHGNDGGGSIRIPASCCGVFGLKPTRGRISMAPDLGDLLSGLVCDNALTRSVRDGAYLLNEVQGPSPGDPYFAPPPRRSYIEVIQKDPPPLKIAFTSKAPTGAPVHQDCRAALSHTVNLLEDLGHDLTERALPITEKFLEEAFYTVWMAGAASGVRNMEAMAKKKLGKDSFEPLTWALKLEGDKRSSGEYLQAIQKLQAYSRKLAYEFEKYDVWLTPTLAQPPVPIGALDSTEDDPMKGFFAGADFVAFTPVWNATGQPAMSVPLFWNQAGLPIGSHFVGRYGEEDSLFQLAAQLERAQPWAGRHPPNF